MHFLTWKIYYNMRQSLACVCVYTLVNVVSYLWYFKLTFTYVYGATPLDLVVLSADVKGEMRKGVGPNLSQ